MFNNINNNNNNNMNDNNLLIFHFSLQFCFNYIYNKHLKCLLFFMN